MNYLLPARWSALVLGMICSIALPWNSESAEQALTAKPEKTRLEVGTAGSGTTSLPLFIAFEAGYFAKRGLNVSVNQVGATIAVQGVISGTIDIYQGGTAAIAANFFVSALVLIPVAGCILYWRSEVNFGQVVPVILMIAGTIVAASVGRVLYQIALSVTGNDNGFVTMFFLLIPALTALISIPLSWWISDLYFAVS